MTEPQIPRKIKRPNGKQRLSDEKLEREIKFRSWFPKDLVFDRDGMTDEQVDRGG